MNVYILKTGLQTWKNYAIIKRNFWGAERFVKQNIGLSPSGKAQDFDSCISLVRIQLAQLK